MNKRIWKGASFNANSVCSMAKNNLQQWRSSRECNRLCTSQASNDESLWERPQPDYVKCNVNASLDNVNAKTGFKFLVRDHEGKFVAGGAGCKNVIIQLKIAEAIGIQEALSWLKKKNVQQGYRGDGFAGVCEGS
ncbi:hypothetical protein LguiA_019712 [Lonicera macranthoides]